MLTSHTLVETHTSLPPVRTTVTRFELNEKVKAANVSFEAIKKVFAEILAGIKDASEEIALVEESLRKTDAEKVTNEHLLKHAETIVALAKIHLVNANNSKDILSPQIERVNKDKEEIDKILLDMGTGPKDFAGGIQ